MQISKKTFKITLITCFLLFGATLMGIYLHNNALQEEETSFSNLEMPFSQEELILYAAQEEGYSSLDEWNTAKQEIIAARDAQLLEDLDLLLEDYISEEDKTTITKLRQEGCNAFLIADINYYFDEIDSILEPYATQFLEDLVIAEAEAQAASSYNSDYSYNYNNYSSNSYSYGGDLQGLRSAGVVYQGGTRYTYYSSNVLYHYRTPEWTVDGDGFYRDSDGYYVVASTDYGQGDVVETPYGEGKVYDSGCASGTIDMYVQ